MITVSVQAIEFTWQLQVTDPSFELSYKTLGNKTYKPFLEKTSWRCTAGELEKKKNLEMRSLFCDYSIEKAGTIKTAISCGTNKDYNEVSLELFDEKKDLTFTVMLLCRKKKEFR